MSSRGDRWQAYRDLIDELVRECRSGQGDIAPSAVREGPEKPVLPEDTVPWQWRTYRVAAKLTADEREDLAMLLAQQFRSGVHAALVTLHEAQISPFEDGYEGTPFHDFVGGLDDWEWPDRPRG
jgi:hypothetical protein